MYDQNLSFVEESTVMEDPGSSKVAKPKTVQACSYCHIRKIKCVPTETGCRACNEAKITCRPREKSRVGRPQSSRHWAWNAKTGLDAPASGSNSSSSRSPAPGSSSASRASSNPTGLSAGAGFEQGQAKRIQYEFLPDSRSQQFGTQQQQQLQQQQQQQQQQDSPQDTTQYTSFQTYHPYADSAYFPLSEASNPVKAEDSGQQIYRGHGPPSAQAQRIPESSSSSFYHEFGGPDPHSEDPHVIPDPSSSSSATTSHEIPTAEFLVQLRQKLHHLHSWLQQQTLSPTPDSIMANQGVFDALAAVGQAVRAAVGPNYQSDGSYFEQPDRSIAMQSLPTLNLAVSTVMDAIQLAETAASQLQYNFSYLRQNQQSMMQGNEAGASKSKQAATATAQGQQQLQQQQQQQAAAVAAASQTFASSYSWALTCVERAAADWDAFLATLASSAGISGSSAAGPIQSCRYRNAKLRGEIHSALQAGSTG